MKLLSLYTHLQLYPEGELSLSKSPRIEDKIASSVNILAWTLGDGGNIGLEGP